MSTADRGENIPLLN